MEQLRNWAEWLGFEPVATAELFPVVSQVIVGVLAALVAWFLIHHGQRRAAEESRRIERATMLHDLDREYGAIMGRRCVIKDLPDPAPRRRGGTQVEGVSVDPAEMWLFEMVLTRRVVWKTGPDRGAQKTAPNAYRYVNGARCVSIAEGYHVDTLTLHEVIAWSKRVASGLQAKVIDPRDIADMWRNILPWAKDNRFTFMAAFFGVSELNSPLGEREEKLARWYGKWHLRPAYRFGQIKARVRALRFRILNKAFLLRRDIPREWSGDVAPLYLLIRTVVCEAFASRRFEILDYLGLAAGPPGAGAPGESQSGLDATIRAVLFSGPEPLGNGAG